MTNTIQRSAANRRRPCSNVGGASQTPAAPAAIEIPFVTSCAWCASHRGTMSPCPSCAAKQKAAYEHVVEKHRSVEETARRMRMSAEKVAVLVELEIERRALPPPGPDALPTALLRELIDQHIATREPHLSHGQIAVRARLDPANIDRMLGYVETGARLANGKLYPSGIREQIPIEQASAIVRALGMAPVEIEGL